ncbi:putative fatty acyl-CoA reductase CG5065 isoform X1 [Leptidea sinapis]|uniref:putative fatty acyl-CoA reductase CG5065 isoform X1 n=2 Tax=Leptidea sinapis TaxID=189913 RepID=UPI002146EEEC|nr:putative fatty acyl-CoA reductase CG5065 isoform X1 [Leptidea sinapis]XP_050678160.1 putative fatty acyl-CoA reductase CG5065 isoform X1 [Leptidea sinapis]
MAAGMGVPEYFAGKTVLVTGGTGFMGKVLLEKLLRCCSDVRRVYLLMRPKRGHSAAERLDDFLQCKVFEVLRASNPQCFSKLVVVPGDILQEDLGISEEHRRLLQEECNCVFHCAACVRFDMFIRDAINLNTVATMKVLKLVEGMKNLEVFEHVSTSYCRCELPILEEKVYPAPHRPHDVVATTRWMDDDLLRYMQPKLIDPQPNTYAYTKSLTEDLVSQYEGKFPIVIARPSIVMAAYKEPVPGWVDNMNGATGLLVGAGKGVIRTMHCNDSYQADIMPVDMAVNACIVLAYLTATDRPREIRVCNVTQSGINPLTWGRALDMGRVHVREFPFSICLWYPGGSPKSSRAHHLVAAFFTHVLPAYFVDLVMFLAGKKTFMVKIQKRVSYGLQVLQYYTTKEWHFRNEVYQALPTRLSARDRELFYTDHRMIEWSDYIRNYIKGAREFCCKEEPATLPAARRRHRQLFYLDLFVQTAVYSLIAYFIYYYIIRMLS